MILHLCAHDKFIPDYIDFIRRRFPGESHRFITYGLPKIAHPYEEGPDTLHYDSLRNHIPALFKYMRQADKIILHSFYGGSLALFLCLDPNLARKCYWVIWGHDLYLFQEPFTLGHARNERLRRIAIKKFAGLVTYVEGDILLARQAYGAKAPGFECIAYPSNIFRPPPAARANNHTLTLLAGHSAADTNCHQDIFEKLEPYKDSDILIYCPLSYGNNDTDYAKNVARKGQEIFGDRFIPFLDFMPLDHYRDILSRIDIAIFANNRQQAMGNSIALLSMGCKVYMRRDITSWDTLSKYGATLYDLAHFDLSPIPNEVSYRNRQAIESYFSEDNMVQQYRQIFEA